MYHIEVTKNGESVVSRDFEEVSIVEHRHVSALYKQGEERPFTIAPSAKTRLTITADEIVIPTGAEYYTMNEPWFKEEYKTITRDKKEPK